MARAKMSMGGLMRCGLRIVVAAFPALLAAGGAAAHPHERVLWAFPLAEPFFRADSTGYGDGIRDWFVERIPEFRHTIAPDMALDRVLDLMRREDGVCHPMLFRTEERMAFVTYSAPVMMTPSILLIASTRGDEGGLALRPDGAAPPDALLASDLRATVMAGRAYGVGVDRLIAELAARDRVQRVNEQAAVFAHLDRGWADFTFGYANEIEAPYTGGLEAIPIAGVETGKLAHIGCSDGPMGRALVAAVDRLVADAGPRPVWLRYYTNMLDEAGRAAFDRALERRAPWGAPEG